MADSLINSKKQMKSCSSLFDGGSVLILCKWKVMNAWRCAEDEQAVCKMSCLQTLGLVVTFSQLLSGNTWGVSAAGGLHDRVQGLGSQVCAFHLCGLCSRV